MAKSIMIQGTMSNAGKSVIAAGLCRIFHQDGYRVAPFKSQNMALNSYITAEGLEMGRAQVMQAQAAGIKPSVLMNPILLKPTNDVGSQVIVNGRVLGNMRAADYFRYKKKLVPEILKAYRALEQQNDILVIEGAGSPAEINLKADDIVNMGLAKLVHSPVLLVGDIDRGGVFASLYGTVKLLEAQEQELIKGLIINKFRGDVEILRPGLSMIEQLCAKQVLGVVPYAPLDLEDEDSLSTRLTRKAADALVDIAVIRLPRISNFTDFNPLESLPGIGVRYVGGAEEFGCPDFVVLPGTKSTMEDLKWLRRNGLEALIQKHAAAGRGVLGICGGYQMMGQSLKDPCGVEGGGETRGMGLLDTRTIFTRKKTRTQASGQIATLPGVLSGLSGLSVEGYEIHMGETETAGKASPFSTVTVPGCEQKMDGCCRENLYGTYLHGLFELGEVASAFAAALLREKGYDPGRIPATDTSELREREYDKLAEMLRKSLDMEQIYRIVEAGA